MINLATASKKAVDKVVDRLPPDDHRLVCQGLGHTSAEAADGGLLVRIRWADGSPDSTQLVRWDELA